MKLARALWSALATVLLSTSATAARPELPPVPGEVIVRFRADASITRVHALAARASADSARQVLAGRASALGLRVGRSLEAGSAIGDRTQVVRGSGDSAALAALLAADPDVEGAWPNGRRRISAAPNDPLYAATAAGVRPNGPDSGQWYLRAPVGAAVSAIDIEAAWARTRGRDSVVVAVLDTGVRMDHPDLAGHLLPGYDFVSNVAVANDGGGRDADPSDPGDWVSSADLTADQALPAGQRNFDGCSVENSSWHGTGTAALVGAGTDDGIGMAGTAPGVKILPLRVLGKCYGTDSDIQAAMRWAVGLSVAGIPNNPNPARVLNLSLGGGTACGSYQAVIDEVVGTGAVVVVAAGNSDGGTVETPANCNGVITVAALRHVGTKVGFSSLGPQVTIAAPGGNCVNLNGACLYPILTAKNSGVQGPATSIWTDSVNPSYGTSFATPLVSGVAALMFSQQPALTPAQLRNALAATARPFPTTGGDSASVPQCQAPRVGLAQIECYCTTSTCGAGMLDAGAAVAAASGPLVRIDFSPAAPTAGSGITFSAAASVSATGSTVVGWQWAIAAGGGIVNGFSSATNGITAELTPSAPGSFTVTLTVTDSSGRTAQMGQTVVVAAAATPVPAGGGGGGGGTTSLPWLALLGLAVTALFRSVPRRA